MTDTIAAIATAPGNGGVGIIRISGSQALPIAQQLSRQHLQPRQVRFAHFFDADDSILDSGLLLYFAAPASYTGEDVLEIQAHGGSVVLNMLLGRVLALGARLAQAGEFTQRAFLNNKLDLAQAEAIADLIVSSTEQSVRSAQRSMQGVFSQQIHALVEDLTELRVYVEAAIDFVDEEIDFLSDGVVAARLNRLQHHIQQILNTAKQGRLLRDGMTVVLAGKPNAGKSSLLNALAGHDAAIVTEIAGTTRDVLRERIQIDGMPLHIIDTAGLRDSDNPVEQEGIRRAKAEMSKADKILLLIDCQDPEFDAIQDTLPVGVEITTVYNKIDLLNLPPKIETTSSGGTRIYLSIKTGAGMDLLTQHLKAAVGFDGDSDDVFIARTRHIDALNRAAVFVANAQAQLDRQAGELVAEELHCAQQSLAEITGEVSSDDLLGRIFSSFCIGK